MSIAASFVRNFKCNTRLLTKIFLRFESFDSAADDKPILTDRIKLFKQKLKENPPPPDLPIEIPKNYEEEPLEAWPNGINPHTGEINGPKGPEPTRYGDWERKGICSDF